MNIAIKDHSLQLQIGGLNLTSADTLGGCWVFHDRSIVRREADCVMIDTTPVDAAGKPMQSLQLHYRFSPTVSGITVTTWITSDAPAVDLAFIWLPLQCDACFDRLLGRGPELTLPMEQVERGIAFNESLTLEGAHSLTLSGCGRIQYIPGTKTLIPFDILAESHMDLRLIDEAHPIRCTITVDGDVPQPAAPAYPQRVAEVQGYELRAGRHVFVLRECGRGILINDVPLFSMELNGAPQKVITSERGWRKVEILPRGRGLTVCLSDHEEIDQLAVTFSACCEDRKILWTGSVSNTNPKVSLQWITWPSLVLEETCDALTPLNSGAIISDWGKVDGYFGGRYPNGFSMPMQFMSFLNPESSLYAGVHDKRGCVKQIDALSGGGRITMQVRVYAENMDRCANAFTLPGEFVWEDYDGGWYEAALLYRAFARNAQWYPADGMARIPEWMRKTPFWIMDWMPNDNPDADPIPISVRPKVPSTNPRVWIEDALRLREALGYPIGYHLYNWHWIPFNNDFPHYFPTKASFAQGVRELEEHQVHVMPYTNALLWDMRDNRGEDDQFTRIAKAYASKNADGSVIWSSYASHEPDGALCRLAHMCPTTALWQKTVRDFVEKLFADYGVSAVYLDQISAHRSELCMDPTHPHLPGGGSFWNEGYARLLDGLRTRMPADGALTSESNAEVYNRWLDGYLTWAWIAPKQVPFFQTVYAGTVVMFGRNTNAYKKEDAPYRRYHFAQSLMTGQSLGWTNADVYKDEQVFGFLKRCVDVRMQYLDWFEQGEIAKPPVMEGDIPLHVCITGMNRQEVSCLPLVDALRWKLGERSCLFIANASDQQISCMIDGKSYLLEACSVSVVEE